jgi:preprotein translocase subunit SecF
MARFNWALKDPHIDFVGQRWIAFSVDGLLLVVALLSLWFQGLNLGIDFTGGVVIEAKSSKTIDLTQLREQLHQLDFGEVAVQNFGTDKDVLIRVQPSDKNLGQEQAVADKIKAALGTGYTFDRIEAVGPKVSSELYWSGVIASILAVLVIAVYVAFRFEWQFGVAALLSNGHDVLMAVGLYSIFQLDFNLTSIAALLMLAGYSINETVIIFDRIRENRRKFKRMELGELINLSTNQTLARTLKTGTSTALSLIPLAIFGGEALFGFAIVMLWGIASGTYSSVFVASSLLLYMPPLTIGQAPQAKAGEPAV